MVIKKEIFNLRHSMAVFKNLADIQNEKSLSNKLRKRRFNLFLSLMNSISSPVRILDVGGTDDFWKKMEYSSSPDIEITILNISHNEFVHKSNNNLLYCIGDGRDMKQFNDREFDIVFSNSVIEHMENFEDQQKMAMEIQRVGQRYFVQTPNYYFPIEPHFLFPFYQFYPISIRTFLLQHFNLGWFNKTSNRIEAESIVKSIRLLRKKEIKKLFPNGSIIEEHFWGMLKSFIIYGGWNVTLK